MHASTFATAHSRKKQNEWKGVETDCDIILKNEECRRNMDSSCYLIYQHSKQKKKNNAPTRLHWQKIHAKLLFTNRCWHRLVPKNAYLARNCHFRSSRRPYSRRTHTPIADTTIIKGDVDPPLAREQANSSLKQRSARFTIASRKKSNYYYLCRQHSAAKKIACEIGLSNKKTKQMTLN